jgi:hypothetical protein
MSVRIEALDDKRSRPCDIRSEVLEHLEVLLPIYAYFDINRYRFGPFEVRECTIGIMAGMEPETGPEGGTGYEGGAPILADVRSGD